jgi:tetratricopeptide (TPR) repeat protein
VYLAQHKYAEAEPLFIKANQINHRVLGEEHPDTLLTMNGLGALYYLEGKYTQAELLFEKALEGQRRVLGDEHEQTLTSMFSLANVYMKQGHYAEAERLYREVLSAREKIMPESWKRFNTQSSLGDSLARQKRYAEAEPLLLSGFEGMLQRKATIASPWPYLEDAGKGLVQFYVDWGKPEKAAEWQKTAPEFCETMIVFGWITRKSGVEICTGSE